MTTVAGATEESIYTLARRTITVKETIQDNGVVVSTYEHMDAFTQAARRQYPNLSDYEPAQFLMDYMGMDSEGIPEEEALKLLTYDNLSLTSTYLKVNEEGIVEMTAEEMERQIQIAILLPIYAMALYHQRMQLCTQATPIRPLEPVIFLCR